MPALPPFRGDYAFFLDLDGTLLDIAETPAAVYTEREELALIEKLRDAAGGAVALVSGRTLASIDEIFAPLRYAAAGQHGFERRDAQGNVHRDSSFPVDELQQAVVPVREFADAHRGLVFEDKGHSVALHFRLAPQFREEAWAAARQAAAKLGPIVEVQGGKMVVELKPAGRDKGRAIEDFMREPPFAGRIPVFIGDDITDEHGFRIVNDLGGHSIKVGVGSTAARWRLPHAPGVRAWLKQWIQKAGPQQKLRA